MEQIDSLEFNVELSSYTGSLEILLELAKQQKIDIASPLISNFINTPETGALSAFR